MLQQPDYNFLIKETDYQLMITLQMYKCFSGRGCRFDFVFFGGGGFCGK